MTKKNEIKFFIKKIIIILFLNPIFAFADTDMDNIFIVGVENYHKPPLHYVKNGEYYGRYKTILDLFASEKGYQFVYKPLKLNQLYLKYYNYEIDFKFPDNPVWRAPDKNHHKVYYSSYIYNYIDSIFVRKKDVGKKIDDFKNLGVIDDVLLWSITKLSAMNKIKIIKKSSCKDLINLLMEGKIDSIMCNYDVMRNYLKEMKLQDTIIFDTDLPYVDDYYYLSSMKHRKIIIEFSRWISENRNKINQIINDEEK